MTLKNASLFILSVVGSVVVAKRIFDDSADFRENGKTRDRKKSLSKDVTKSATAQQPVESSEYTIILSRAAENDLKTLKDSGQDTKLDVISKLFEQLRTAPLAKVLGDSLEKHEKYKKRPANQRVYSRRVSRIDRLVFTVDSDTKVVHILRAAGHTDDERGI